MQTLYCKQIDSRIFLEMTHPFFMECFVGDRWALEGYLKEIVNIPTKFRFYSPQTDLTASELIREIDRRNARPTTEAAPVRLGNAPRSSTTSRQLGRSVD
jgi:hypothetical protein